MTIIYENGNEFWIEYFQVSITIGDAAGTTTSSASFLERDGAFLGCAMIGRNHSNNDNTQAVSAMEIKSSGGGTNINFGDEITQINLRITKAAGTAGNTTMTFHVLVFMRGVIN